MLWSFPVLSLLLLPFSPPHRAPHPASIFLRPGASGSSFSPKAQLFILQILSRAQVLTLRCSLSGLPAPLTRTLTWALVLRAPCLPPCLPWKRFRWSYNVLTSGRGSMTLEPRWLSPKQAGKDNSLIARFKDQENKLRSCYIFLFIYLWWVALVKPKPLPFTFQHLGILIKCFFCVYWILLFSSKDHSNLNHLYPHKHFLLANVFQPVLEIHGT